MPLQRARVMGGCSSHNGCAAVWGHRSDYDAWAVANPGWSAAEVEPLFREVDARLRVHTPAAGGVDALSSTPCSTPRRRPATPSSPISAQSRSRVRLRHRPGQHRPRDAGALERRVCLPRPGAPSAEPAHRRRYPRRQADARWRRGSLGWTSSVQRARAHIAAERVILARPARTARRWSCFAPGSAPADELRALRDRAAPRPARGRPQPAGPPGHRRPLSRRGRRRSPRWRRSSPPVGCRGKRARSGWLAPAAARDRMICTSTRSPRARSAARAGASTSRRR